MCVCVCVCFFLLFKLLVTRLKEAFNNAKLNRDDELRNTLILTTGEIGRYGTPFVNTQEQNSLKFSTMLKSKAIVLVELLSLLSC